MAALEEVAAAEELDAVDAAASELAGELPVAEAEGDDAPPAAALEAVAEAEADAEDEETSSRVLFPQMTDWQAVWPSRSLG